MSRWMFVPAMCVHAGTNAADVTVDHVCPRRSLPSCAPYSGAARRLTDRHICLRIQLLELGIGRYMDAERACGIPAMRVPVDPARVSKHLCGAGFSIGARQSQQPKADRSEVMVECEGLLDPVSLHEDEARRVHCGELVQVLSLKIGPSVAHI